MPSIWFLRPSGLMIWPQSCAQWKFVTRARMLSETVTRCLARGAVEESRSACERSPSPIADVFLVGYERLGRAKPEHVATAVHRERLRADRLGKLAGLGLGAAGGIGAEPRNHDRNCVRHCL